MRGTITLKTLIQKYLVATLLPSLLCARPSDSARDAINSLLLAGLLTSFRRSTAHWVSSLFLVSIEYKNSGRIYPGFRVPPLKHSTFFQQGSGFGAWLAEIPQRGTDHLQECVSDQRPRRSMQQYRLQQRTQVVLQ